jgi:CobQ-like glutamine amidotransferase family enzyme/UDP-N-acetylmuramyl tripeptide synthase
VIGGRVALGVAPDLLGTLTTHRTVALVSGTNGKTTTTRLLAAALGAHGPVASSRAGANLPPGLAMALAMEPSSPLAVLEVDEAYLGAVADVVHPQVIVLLNLSRDQLDRVSEVRMVAARWRSALAGTQATVVANADDPLVAWAAREVRDIHWVAAGQVWQQDATGCPACEGRLKRNAGDWSCACGFRRPVPQTILTDGAFYHVGEQHTALNLRLPGRFNQANAVMAAVAAGQLGVAEPEAIAAMSAVTEVEGRFAVIEYRGVTARLLLSKNPAGWAELLGLLEGEGTPVVVGINARIADGHDPSWLWDVPFERLAGRLVVATGERCHDLAVRLRYAGVDHVAEPDVLASLLVAGQPSVDFVGNYTAFQDLRKRLARPETQTGRRNPRPPAILAGRAVPEVRTVLSSRETTGTVDSRELDAPRLSALPDRSCGGTKRTPTSALRVVVVHPDLLGTYGDGGNGTVLAGRAAWRGNPVELLLAPSDRPLPTSADLYCLGGGEDGPQLQAASVLREGALSQAVAQGAAVLAVCAGFQILGTSFPGANGISHPGVGLLDASTVRGDGPRAVGEVVAEVPDAQDTGWLLSVDPLSGFENHAGVTHLGPGVRPLGRVIRGVGNGAGDGTEGAVSGRVVGTYLHGPVLARNPSLADLLLSFALEEAPAALEDEEESILRRERLAAGQHDVQQRPGSRAVGRELRRRLPASVRHLVSVRRI